MPLSIKKRPCIMLKSQSPISTPFVSSVFGFCTFMCQNRNGPYSFSLSAYSTSSVKLLTLTISLSRSLYALDDRETQRSSPRLSLNTPNPNDIGAAVSVRTVANRSRAFVVSFTTSLSWNGFLGLPIPSSG